MDKKPKRMVPEVRFKGFTDDWEQRKLGDVSKVHIGGGTPSTKNKEYWNGNIPWIQSSSLIENDIWNVNVEKFVSSKAIKESSTKLIPKGAIAVVTRVGVGKLALINFDYSTSQDFLSLADLQEIPAFLALALYKKLKIVSHQLQGTSIKGITSKDLLNLSLKFPNKYEQNQIFRIIQFIDKLLSLQQKKLEQLKLLKKAMLQQLFVSDKNNLVPNIRFSGFNSSWEQRKLGEVAKFINGKAYKQNELLESGKYPVLRVGNFYTNNDWYYSNLQLDSDKYIDKGDLVYTWSATFGPHIWKGPKVIYHYHIWKINYSDNISENFLYQFLNADRNKLTSNTNGSTMPHITKRNMEEKVLHFPSKNEQTIVGRFLSIMDNLISLQQSKINQLLALKKYMLQKLFI